MSLRKRLEALEAAHVTPTSIRECSDAVLRAIVAKHLCVRGDQVTHAHLAELCPTDEDDMEALLWLL